MRAVVRELRRPARDGPATNNRVRFLLLYLHGPLSERRLVTETNAALRIIIIGSRILPYRHAGDKNFWLEVIQELEARGHQVQVLSVTLEPVSEPTPYRCEYVRPVPVRLGGGSRFNEQYQYLRTTINYYSKTFSLVPIARSLRHHIQNERPDVIHFSSNYGPFMASLKPFVRGVPLSISANSYNGGSILYNPALMSSFLGFDAIVPFSDACARQVRGLGIPAHRVRTIRWGVDLDRFQPLSDAAREKARGDLGIQPGEKVVLWAGFLTQMTLEDFEFSIRAAELVLREAPRGWRFFFCLKPEHFDSRFRRFEKPGLTVVGTSEVFLRVQRAADVMLSPMTNLRSTAAPPLTWVECMAFGIPLVTTPLPGADEIVTDGRNGFLVRTPEEAAQRLMDACRSPERLADARREARRRIEERFALSVSVTDYINLWTSLAARGRSS